MRDTFKDQAYFEEFIEEDSERVKKYEENLSHGEIAPERILDVKRVLFSIKYGIFSARYSKGDDLSLLRNEFELLLNEWLDIFDPDDYCYDLWMVSLAVLFDMGSEVMERIKTTIQNAGLKDWLLDFLVSGGNVDMEEKCKFKTPYQTLKELKESESRKDILKRYVTKEWYRGHSDCGWYNNHKKKINIYFGYWSFEAAAMAKILSIPDDSLNGKKYYPYDLVRFQKE